MTKTADKRCVCSEEKKSSIKASISATALKRKNQILKIFECKIVEKRLNNRQKSELEQIFREGKWFYNHVLGIHKDGVRLNEINTTHIKTVDHFDKDKNKVSSDLEVLNAQQKQAIVTRMISNEKAIENLVKRGFQKRGDLRFRKDFDSIPLKQYGISYVFKTVNKVRIGGISGKILLRTGGQLRVADDLANANLVRKPDGYYLMVTAFINKENHKEKPKNGKEIGLDFGIKTNLTTSEGEKIDLSVEEGERLKRLQRKLARRLKGSNNRYKTIKLIQREYQKLSNRKRDMANKIVSRLKKYETIVIQDEQLSGWQKGLFGKQVHHSCMGRVKAMLKRLPQTIILDRWVPTTKWCPNCGTINKYVTLSDRVYRCGCGHEEDRDIHSAKNMLVIKDLVFSKNNFVPTEHREITLEEFKTSTDDGTEVDMSEQ